MNSKIKDSTPPPTEKMYEVTMSQTQLDIVFSLLDKFDSGDKTLNEEITDLWSTTGANADYVCVDGKTYLVSW